jgi:hypothetical protein
VVCSSCQMGNRRQVLVGDVKRARQKCATKKRPVWHGF